MGSRILAPEGKIIRTLLGGEVLSPVEIIRLSGVPRATTYSNLKDLLIAGWVVEREGKYIITPSGVKAYLSEVLPDDIDVSRLISVAKSVKASPARLVSLGIRLIMDIVENGELPESLGYMLSRYDPSALDELMSMLERREGKQAAEVVA